MSVQNPPISQCQKPNGWLGRFVLWNMNSRHSKLTDWGLTHISIGERDMILNIGCGGGRTLSKLAARATQGKAHGVDYSEESVAASRKTNAHWIALNRAEVSHGSVSQLPFPDNFFDLICAVESHFWWPDLPGDLREIFRVLKPGGTLILIAEIYRGANTAIAKYIEKHPSKFQFKLLSVDEHRELLGHAGYSDVQIIEEPRKGWISALGKKA